MNCPYPDCGAPLKATSQFCPNCGRSVKAVAVTDVNRNPAGHAGNAAAGSINPQFGAEAVTLRRRYTALRAVAVLYIVVAVLVLILSGIAAFYIFVTLESASPFGRSSDQETMAALSAAGVFLGGFLLFLFIYASAEVINVFIDIEENTRATRKILEQRD